jgi:hypothetical protein
MADKHQNGDEPTNAEIFTAIGVLQQKLEEVYIQTKKTNGRVTRLEEWKKKADVIADYLKEHPSLEAKSTAPGPKAIDWQAIVLKLIGAITALAAVISAILVSK